MFSFDAYRSVVLNENAGLSGLKIGTTLNKKHKMGLGLYFLKNDIVRPGVNLDVLEYPEATDTTVYRFGYASLFYEPIWFRTRRWELSSPLHLGSANVEAYYKNNSGELVQYFKGGAPLTVFSGVAQFKVFRWFALGTGVGYRALLIKDDQAKRSFNSPVYTFQVKVMLGVLYKVIFKKPIDDGWEDER